MDQPRENPRKGILRRGSFGDTLTLPDIKARLPRKEKSHDGRPYFSDCSVQGGRSAWSSAGSGGGGASCASAESGAPSSLFFQQYIRGAEHEGSLSGGNHNLHRLDQDFANVACSDGQAGDRPGDSKTRGSLLSTGGGEGRVRRGAALSSLASSSLPLANLGSRLSEVERDEASSHGSDTRYSPPGTVDPGRSEGDIGGGGEGGAGGSGGAGVMRRRGSSLQLARSASGSALNDIDELQQAEVRKMPGVKCTGVGLVLRIDLRVLGLGFGVQGPRSKG